MSNERSPRGSCWTTTGTRGMLGLLSAPVGLRICPHASVLATSELQEAAVPVVNRDVVLPVPRERAWELITEPEELEGWLGDEVEFAPVEDAPVRVAWKDGDAREGVV